MLPKLFLQNTDILKRYNSLMGIMGLIPYSLIMKPAKAGLSALYYPDHIT